MKLFFALFVFIMMAPAFASCPKILKNLEFMNEVHCTSGSEVGAQSVVFSYRANHNVELILPYREVIACDEHPVHFVWEELSSSGEIISSHNAEWAMTAEAGKTYQLKVLISETDCEEVHFKFFVTPNTEW